MARKNHFLGALAVAAGILAAVGMLVLMTLVVKVGPARAQEGPNFAFSLAYAGTGSAQAAPVQAQANLGISRCYSLTSAPSEVGPLGARVGGLSDYRICLIRCPTWGPPGLQTGAGSPS
jgi:hypothetical protein